MGRPRRSLEDFLSDRTGQRIHDDNVTSEILTFRQALVLAVLHFPSVVAVSGGYRTRTAAYTCPLLVLLTNVTRFWEGG